MLDTKLLTSVLEQSQLDPKFFFDNVLGCQYWSKQVEIAHALVNNRKVTVKSCHGIGKTYITARIVLWFLCVFPNSIVITTAPTFRQVKELTWREISAARANSINIIGGDLNTTNLSFDDNWYAVGFSSDKPDNFQGFHAPSGHILVVVEEACGVSQATHEALTALDTSQHSRKLLIGNPTQPLGEFYDSFSDPDYYKVSVSAYESPNFIANGITDRSKLIALTKEEIESMPVPFPFLVTPQWAWERYHNLGGEHPMFISRVEANFPSESDNTLIPYWAVEKALTRISDKEEQKLYEGCRTIGIDVARFGSDNTVLIALDRTLHEKTVSFNGKNTMQTVAAGIKLFKELGMNKELDCFVVDDTGVGGGVTDRLTELGYRVLRINFADASYTPETYANIKAEIFDYLAKEMKAGDLSIRDDGELVKQFRNILFDYTSSELMFIVSKKEMKRRGFSSPDFVDAMALAVWGRDFGTGLGNTVVERVRPQHERDGGTIFGNLLDRDI